MHNQHPPTINIITLFPDAFPGTLGLSIIGRALQRGLWNLNVYDLRKHGIRNHKSVDDTPYGGGCGMVIRPDVVHAALEEIFPPTPNQTIILDNQPTTTIAAPLDQNTPPANYPDPDHPIIYLSPRGKQVSQPVVQSLSTKKSITLLCGRYEGVDQRVLDHWRVQEVRVGDAVLCGGEVAAMLLVEACVRLLPGVVHAPESILYETFSTPNLAEHPHYTRPQLWNNIPVPDVLRSGNHAQIEKWRCKNSFEVEK